MDKMHKKDIIQDIIPLKLQINITQYLFVGRRGRGGGNNENPKSTINDTIYLQEFY